LYGGNGRRKILGRTCLKILNFSDLKLIEFLNNSKSNVMKNLLYIFLGGGFGSVMRFVISNYNQKLWSINTFPMGTFVVNILGCFLIGIFSEYFLKADHYLKFLFITGFCGGFTTFSTLSAENYSLWQNEAYGILILYVLLSVFVGLLAVYLGLQVVKN
jgi:CrcB protein